MGVFIRTTAGSCRKYHRDEETFRLLRVEEVSGPYPFPYGFVSVSARPRRRLRRLPGDRRAVDGHRGASRMRTGGADRADRGRVVGHSVLAVLSGKPAPDLPALAQP
ncbi:MAG TPA: hypothetical protein VLS92_09720 [Acidimicrobiia bacterium]|nr:hypothetical protein [Acidimicrobiia bacterium]